MNNTMSENKKATAPIPAVGAAGEQSKGTLTQDIIPEKAGERNLRKGSLDTLSMSALYDTAYPPKSVIIENLLYAGTYPVSYTHLDVYKRQPSGKHSA